MIPGRAESSGSVAYARRVGPFFESIPNRPIRVDARIHIEEGSPRLVDSQASDAGAIGIYPVYTQWTVVDR
jgi:hypothetical protein